MTIHTNIPMHLAAMAVLTTAALAAGCGDDASSDNAASPDPAMAALIADYPLDTCVVTGSKLGSMGEPDNRLYEGQLVRFCCSTCLKDFNDDPQQYVAMIDEAKARQE